MKAKINVTVITISSCFLTMKTTWGTMTSGRTHTPTSVECQFPTVCGVSHCGKDFLRVFRLIRYSYTLEYVLPSPLMKVNLRLAQYMTEVLSKGVLFSFVYGNDILVSLVICSL